MRPWRIIVGDCRTTLASLEPGSVRTVVTSPPYWGLRDYGTAVWEGGDPDHEHRGTTQRQQAGGAEKQYTNVGSVQVYSGDCSCGAVRHDDQLGLEDDVGEYVAAIVDVFRGVRDVLADDGTVWLNLGDSYATAGTRQGNGGGGGIRQYDQQDAHRTFARSRVPDGFKAKDLVGVPWRVAFALQADGWYLRADVIWAKPNPMPESVTDRPTKSHEYVFLLTKRPRYYYDADAIAEPAMEAGRVLRYGPGTDNVMLEGIDDHFRTRFTSDAWTVPANRNARSVWAISTTGYDGAHFATMPAKLAARCVAAGTSERGHCPACGAPWVRIVERTPTIVPERVRADRVGVEATPMVNDGERRRAMNGDPQNAARTTHLGWRPTCDHDLEPVADVVLDPFAGAGTTGVVALRMGRSFVGIELNPEYAEMARERIRNDAPLFNVATEVSG